ASGAGALAEQIEVQYGPDDRAIKLAGTAKISFGRSPRLDAVLSAIQVDLDRALNLPEPARRLPVMALRAFAERFSRSLRLQIPARIGIGIDTVALAGAAVQAVRGDITADADGWVVETFEFRAPGLTQARLRGRLDVLPERATFRGPANLDSGDPK